MLKENKKTVGGQRPSDKEAVMLKKVTGEAVEKEREQEEWGLPREKYHDEAADLSYTGREEAEALKLLK